MRVQLPSAEGEKLCHARPGQVVRFGAESGDSASKFPGVYIVCLTEQPAKQKPQDGSEYQVVRRKHVYSKTSEAELRVFCIVLKEPE